MTEHTQGAVEAARIIIRGKKRIHTEYGFKTVRGLAALIDRKTGAADLLAACKRGLDALEIEQLAQDANGNSEAAKASQPFIDELREAIARTKKTPAA